MSRLFYPILFGVTAALAATVWLRHGLSVQWLLSVDAQVARAQSADPPAPADRSGGPPSIAGRDVPPAPVGDASTAGNASLPAGALPRRRLPSNMEAIEISAPILMPSTKVVARIHKSEVILAADVMPHVEAIFKQIAAHNDPADHEKIREMLLRQYLQEVVDRKLIVAEMKKNVPPDKLPEFQKGIEGHFAKNVLPVLLKEAKVKTEAEFAAKLKEKGTTLESVKREFIEQALYQEWMKKEATDDKEVTHDEMLRYYYEHFDEYKYEAKARFEVLHASFKRHRDRQEAWRLICELGNEVVRGRPFAEAAKARSEGLHADRGGAWDWTTKGSLRSKAIDAAIFSLPVGQLSDVLEDGSGFSIVRVVERKEAGVKSFRETQAEIRTKIKDDRKEKHRKEAMAKFLEKNRPSAWTIFDDQPLIEQAAPPRKQPRRR